MGQVCEAAAAQRSSQRGRGALSTPPRRRTHPLHDISTPMTTDMRAGILKAMHGSATPMILLSVATTITSSASPKVVPSLISPNCVRRPLQVPRQGSGFLVYGAK